MSDNYQPTHSERMFFNRAIWSLIGGHVAAISFGAGIVMLLFTKYTVIGCFLVLLELVGVLLAIRAGDSSDTWLFGLMGEKKIAVILDQMWHDGVRSVNGKKFANGDVDHIVVAPTGVWAIESKFIGGNIDYMRGQLTINGSPNRKNFLQQAYAEALAVERFLESKGITIEVKPVLAFSDKFAKVRFGTKKIENVNVISSMGFRYLILDPSLPRILNQDQISRILGLLDAHKI